MSLFVILSPFRVLTYAVSSGDINKDDVFVKQKSASTCTLASIVMVMRRTAIIEGDRNFKEITEDSVRSTAWKNGAGLLWNFTSFGMTVNHGYFSESGNKSELLSLLTKYPQGIVAYNNGNAGQNHSVVITDYNESEDAFYAADPANNCSDGRIKLSETTIKGDSENEKIANFTSYWYVSSPGVKLENGEYVITGCAPQNNPQGNQSSYDPSHDISSFNRSTEIVNNYYVASSGLRNGAPLRDSPSGSGNAVNSLQKGEILFINSIGKNTSGASWAKNDEGFYIFLDNITPFSKYSSEITKFNNTEKNAEGTYKVSSTTDVKAPLRIDPSEGNNIVSYLHNDDLIYIKSSGVNSAGASWLKTENGYYIKASEASFQSAEKLPSSDFTGEISKVAGLYKSEPIADAHNSGDGFPMTFKITASSLFMRKSPVDGEIILTIHKGETVSVTETASGWGLIEYQGKTGWISLQYAEKTSETHSPLIESVNLSSNSVIVGDKVECDVKIRSGGTALYKFSVYDNDGKIASGGNFQSSPKYVYQTTKAGRFYFFVEIKDTNGHTERSFSADFKVADHLHINSVTPHVDGYSYIFEPLEWTVEGENILDGTIYNYLLTLDGKTVYTLESNDNVFTYVPENPGEYVLSVVAKLSSHTSERIYSKSVNVYNVLAIDSIKINSTSVKSGDNAVILMSASGGLKPYSYSFSVFKDDQPLVNGSYDDSPFFRYTFPSTGEYSIFCAVKDSANTVVSSFSAKIKVTDWEPGDANFDGEVTANDARAALRYSAKLANLTAEQILAADMNNDGKVTALDARFILRKSAKLV